jgi:S-adenosyl methyltransferase
VAYADAPHNVSRMTPLQSASRNEQRSESNADAEHPCQTAQTCDKVSGIIHDAAEPSLPWPGFDPNIPNIARVYDCLLGGKDNFAADRQAAARLLEAVPGAAVAARENRAFLGRAVRFLAEEAGIRQFLDIGAGLPSARAVHEIVRGCVPMARVVYADHDPVVIRHVDALIGGALNVAAVQADLRQPCALLAQATMSRRIDLAEPIAILLVAVLHFLDDSDDPWAVVNFLKDQIAPGSYVAISHVTDDHIPAGAAQQARQAYQGASAPGVPRTWGHIARFFGGLDLVSPGLVKVSAWRPGRIGAPPGPALFYAGIGRKTGPGCPR